MRSVTFGERVEESPGCHDIDVWEIEGEEVMVAGDDGGVLLSPGQRDEVVVVRVSADGRDVPGIVHEFCTCEQSSDERVDSSGAGVRAELVAQEDGVQFAGSASGRRPR